jgi:selenocysteine-specific elongation factor
VRALTGAKTDRLPEERRRGITLELGFASWSLSDNLTASVIDVPGHEGLVHTMVAGAWGLDLLLLVVAADEGVMPQTREHLSIAALLGIRGMVVALSKADRVDAALLDLARDEVRLALAHAGFAEAPVVPVSAVTGEGLGPLKTVLVAALQRLPPRVTDGVAFLPIDRVFSMKGFGTVVTGTLSGGSLSVSDLLDVHPGPKGLRARGLQSHGVSVSAAEPSWRTALNLPGVAVADIPRGGVLYPSGALVPTRRVDAYVRTLCGAPWLKDHAALALHLGTAAIPARLRRVFGGVQPVDGRPDRPELVQLCLAREIVTRPGQRFILRGHRRLQGQGCTVGGGEIVDPHPPRRRLGRPETVAALVALESGDVRTRLAQAVLDAGQTGVDVNHLKRRLPFLDLELCIEDLVGRDQLRRARFSDGNVLWHVAAVDRFATRLRGFLSSYHQEHPQDAVLPVEAARTSVKVNGLPLDRQRFVALLKVMKDPQVVTEGDGLRLGSHRARSVSAALLEQVGTAYRDSGNAPPGRGQVGILLGISESQVSDAVRALVAAGRLVRVKEDLHFGKEAYDALVCRSLEFIDRHGSMTTQQFKELMGESRKYVIPFLEHLDDAKVTLRVGEKRVRRRQPSSL